jgi:hypothetical protein
MKGIAIILAGCMLFLNLGNLRENFQFSVEAAGMECCADSCADCCDTEGDSDKDCPPTCDCSNQFQITAIAYHFMEVTGITVQSYHYGNYVNSYTFEYSADFLQPPRFG